MNLFSPSSPAAAPRVSRRPIPSTPRRAACGAFTLLELLCVMVLVGLLASLLLPALGRAKSQAYQAACVNHLRQLAIAARVYADEHQDRLPSAEILPSRPVDPAQPLPRLRDVLASYAGGAGGASASNLASTVFRCPEDRKGRFGSEGSSYEWNADLNGRRLDETRGEGAFLLLERGNPAAGVTNFEVTFSPATTPMLLDYDPVHPRSAGPGKNVAYMDGHVRMLGRPGGR